LDESLAVFIPVSDRFQVDVPLGRVLQFRFLSSWPELNQIRSQAAEFASGSEVKFWCFWLGALSVDTDLSGFERLAVGNPIVFDLVLDGFLEGLCAIRLGDLR